MADNDQPAPKCPAQTAGYDGMFGVYCELPEGHDGLHNDGHVEWRFVNSDFEPARAAELYRQEQEALRRP